LPKPEAIVNDVFPSLSLYSGWASPVSNNNFTVSVFKANDNADCPYLS